MPKRTIPTLLLLSLPAGLHAASPRPAGRETAPATARIAEIVPLLNGVTAPSRILSPSALAQLPAARISAGFAELRQRFGKAVAVEGTQSESPTSRIVAIRMERALLRMRMTTEPQPPHRITALLVLAVDVPSDNLGAVAAALRELPGRVAFSIASLGEEGPVGKAGAQADQPMAIGSAFKLFVLAELVRQIKGGERRWSDVVPLDRQSLPSGILQDWPKGAPITLHSLAALMISRSDNSAADTLLALLGREKVEALLPLLGLETPERNRPFLSTLELFAIKADPALTARWSAADEAGRRAMLPALAQARVDAAALAGAPKAIDRVEWYASPNDLVRTMDWLRRNADETALAILSINSGIGAEAARDFAYLGYKGGSETGVIEMTFLLRRKDGGWRALAIAWNDPAAAIDEGKFVALAARLVALQR